MAERHLLIELISRELYAGSVDDDHKIAFVEIRGKGRLAFAAQKRRHARGQTSQYLPIGINQMPLESGFVVFLRKISRFHEGVIVSKVLVVGKPKIQAQSRLRKVQKKKGKGFERLGSWALGHKGNPRRVAVPSLRIAQNKMMPDA